MKRIKINILDENECYKIYLKMKSDGANKLLISKGIFTITHEPFNVYINILKHEFQLPTGMSKFDIPKLIANLHFLMLKGFKLKENEYHIIEENV